MFHFSSGADTSQHEKDVQESTEDQQGENVCHENLDNESVGNESLGENEDISTDYEHWNIPREIEESSASEEECTPVPFPSERADRRLAGASSFEDNYQWLSFSQTKRGWMCKICEVYLYSGGSSKGGFSRRPCLNTSDPNHAFKKHDKSPMHKKLELKLSSNEASVYDYVIAGAVKINLNKRHTNHLYMRKCIDTIYFMIQKNIALSENYGDMNFIAEKLPANYKTIPNATYTSYTSAESLVDAIKLLL